MQNNNCSIILHMYLIAEMTNIISGLLRIFLAHKTMLGTAPGAQNVQENISKQIADN